MDFVSSRELRTNPAPVFERLRTDRELVITSRGQPVALLVGVSGDDFEETIRAIRRARAELATAQIRAIAREKGLDSMSLEEIDEEIAAARAERRSR